MKLQMPAKVIIRVIFVIMILKGTVSRTEIGNWWFWGVWHFKEKSLLEESPTVFHLILYLLFLNLNFIFPRGIAERLPLWMLTGQPPGRFSSGYRQPSGKFVIWYRWVFANLWISPEGISNLWKYIFIRKLSIPSDSSPEGIDNPLE